MYFLEMMRTETQIPLGRCNTKIIEVTNGDGVLNWDIFYNVQPVASFQITSLLIHDGNQDNGFDELY